MRKEASLKQWKKLYETAAKIADLKPWEKFWDMDLFAIRKGAEEDTVFFNILGRNGECYGITVYEGYEGFNAYLMLVMQESMNLSVEYAMFHQKNLTCYWGNREELSEKQRKTIKDLGYKYRGKNQWLYFLSYEPGYYPYNMNEDEVLRMSEHLQDLLLALTCYDDEKMNVDFEGGNMFLLSLDRENKIRQFGEEPLPFTSFQFDNLLIENEILLSELKKAKKSAAVLEADISVMVASLNDKKYERPVSPSLSLIGDATTGMMLCCEMLGPEDDAVIVLAEKLLDFIFRYGAPKEIRVSNIIVEAGLKQICDTCGIKLRRIKRLQGVDEFMREMSNRFF